MMKQFALFIALSLTTLASTTLPAQAKIASWYGPGFHGKLTANGETYNMHAMTAAHKKLPFGTKVKVTNTRNGKSTVVCINDRGPYAKGRVIDLSKKANQTIDCNLCKVKLDIISKPKKSVYGKKVC